MANPTTKIKNISKTVEDVLKNYPKARDNDNYLSCVIWHKQVRETIHGDVTFENFLTMYSNNMLSSSDTISRAARKLKETNPEYRGETYEDRKRLELETRLTINKL